MFYEPAGGDFVATENTRGPWSVEHQHGGPPAALMARAIERTLEGFQVARVTVDLFRPVPIAKVSVAVESVRAGKTVREVHATLKAGDRELCRARAIAIRSASLELPALPPRKPSLPPPEESEPFVFPFFAAPVGYQTAMEARIARGRFGEGALALWMRMRHPLVPGETPSALQRVLIAADSGNGISAALDPLRFTFVNPDLSVYLHRPAEGEWVCVDAATTPWPSGIGLAEAALHDARGPIGRSLQSLVVERR